MKILSQKENNVNKKLVQRTLNLNAIKIGELEGIVSARRKNLQFQSE